MKKYALDATPDTSFTETDKEYINQNVSVSGNANDGCKHKVNFELTENKLDAIERLRSLTYLTPPVEISKLLENIFLQWPSKEGHWLYISQQYTPRAINRVIAGLVKLHTSGRITIQNPAAYFTWLIKHRKKRKLIAINGSC
jgi:hypothetical protein